MQVSKIYIVCVCVWVWVYGVGGEGKTIESVYMYGREVRGKKDRQHSVCMFLCSVCVSEREREDTRFKFTSSLQRFLTF